MRRFLGVVALLVLSIGSAPAGVGDEFGCIESLLASVPSPQEAVASYCQVHGARLSSGCTIKATDITFATSYGYRVASILFFPQAHTYRPRLGRVGYVRFTPSDEVSVRYCSICRELALAWASSYGEHPNQNLWADFAMINNAIPVACGNGHFEPIRSF